MKTNMIYKIPLPPVFLCPPPPLFPPPIQSGGRRNFSNNARRQQQQQQQQQQQNSANSMMQQHGGHGQQDSLPSHCVSPMSQGAGVSSQSVPDPHQVSSRTNAGESVALLELCVCVCVCVRVRVYFELLSFPAGPSQLGVLPEQPAEHEELVLQQTRVLLQRHPVLLLLPAPAPGAWGKGDELGIH